MMSYLRYALATIFFAASVGCLALWWRTVRNERTVVVVSYISHISNQDGTELMFYLEAKQGEAIFTIHDEHSFPERGWKAKSVQTTPKAAARTRDILNKLGLFHISEPWIYFPLWYPALIFTLAGVGIVRARRQFSIRSAMVATTIVAALIAMAVIL
jgi:hypothetical protein